MNFLASAAAAATPNPDRSTPTARVIADATHDWPSAPDCDKVKTVVAVSLFLRDYDATKGCLAELQPDDDGRELQTNVPEDSRKRPVSPRKKSKAPSAISSPSPKRTRASPTRTVVAAATRAINNAALPPNPDGDVPLPLSIRRDGPSPTSIVADVFEETGGKEEEGFWSGHDRSRSQVCISTLDEGEADSVGRGFENARQQGIADPARVGDVPLQ